MTTEPLTLLAAFLLAVVATARATRLVVHDSFPPMLWLRLRFLTWAGHKDSREQWGNLGTCPFCLAPWIAGVVEAVAIAAGVWSPDLTSGSGWWWALAVWAAGSYLASMIVLRDEPPEEH